MEWFTGSGSPQQRPTFHTKLSIPFPRKPLHTMEPHFSSPLRPLAATRDHHLRRLPEDTELSIFDAERYFNEGRDQTGGRRQKKGLVFDRADASTIPRESRAIRNASWLASWRSQPGTLPDLPAGSVTMAAKPSPVNKQRRGPSSAWAWPLGGSCPCYRRKAVDVEEKNSVPRSPNHLDFDGIGSVSLNKKEAKVAGEEIENCVSAAAAGGDRGGAPMEHELGFGVEEMVKLRLAAESWIDGQDLFISSSDLLRHEAVQFATTFSDGRQTVAAQVRIPNRMNQPDDPTRDLLEVFWPAEESTTPRESAEFRRRVIRRLFPGDGPPRRNVTFPASPVARVASVEDELASDSSSDLFEIESFSTQTTPSRPTYRRGSSLDETTTTPRTMKTQAGSFLRPGHHELSTVVARGWVHTGRRSVELPVGRGSSRTLPNTTAGA